jgi:GxxExxY protein
METELIFGKEVYEIIGAALEVHKTLGHGFLEAIYQEALEYELSERRIPFRAQVELKVKYKNRYLQKTYVADLVAYDKIIVELKALANLSGKEEAQLINYLKATGFKVGLLINFGSAGKLEWKRFVH